ncbi:MAG: aspartate aminotransferase family protein [Thermoleophilia bacterium]|nr:aspartate aminotransferase family protein [Thermoleophilia bacterium]
MEPVDIEQVESWDRNLILHPGVKKADYEPQLVDRAEGSWLVMADGTRLLDFHSQYACTGVGHGHPSVRAALHEAVDRLDHVAELMTAESRARASHLLLKGTMPESGWAGSVRFTCSGSEAVEVAFLLARLRTGRPLVLTRQTAFHGWTTGAGSATTIPYMNNLFIDSEEVVHRPAPDPSVRIAPSAYCERCALGESDEHCREPDGTLTCVAETEKMIRSLGVENVAAYMTEFWCGAAGYLVHEDYPRQIREMTRRLGILLIDDEALSGMGRTGKWWAYEHYEDAEPDLMISAKGLTSAAVPCGAVMMSEEIAEYFASGKLHSYSTFSGHPLAMAAVSATIETMLSESIPERVAEMGKKLTAGLERLIAIHPTAQSVRGLGLARALELVRNPVTLERWLPEDRWWDPSVDPQPELNPSALIAEECLKRGVHLFSFVPNAVTINPPLCLTESELDFALGALDEALSVLDEMQ